jgi:hypothetical protein
MIPTRHFNWQITPALAIETVCCYIAYSKEDESLALSNSSMAHIPLSDKINAPA